MLKLHRSAPGANEGNGRINGSTPEPGEMMRVRFEAARERDQKAIARDITASARDLAAAARDLAMARRETLEGRIRAAEDRALAAQDRREAAADRAEAAVERLQALEDREVAAAELSLAATDPLTGARTRAAGLSELEHELDRCRRTGGSLVVVYLDVAGLKQLNDTRGHAAGDALLRRVAALVMEHLRPYDLVIRVGGDEFVCAISNMPEGVVRGRFAAIAQALTAVPGKRGIRTGFASYRTGESVAQIVARADADMVGPSRRSWSHRAPVFESRLV